MCKCVKVLEREPSELIWNAFHPPKNPLKYQILWWGDGKVRQVGVVDEQYGIPARYVDFMGFTRLPDGEPCLVGEWHHKCGDKRPDPIMAVPYDYDYTKLDYILTKYDIEFSGEVLPEYLNMSI